MKKLIWNIAKRFLAMVPIVLLFLYMYGQLVTLEQRNAREQIVSEHTGHLLLMEYMVHSVFDEYYATLHLIRNSNEMAYYLADPSSENEKEVHAFFTRMSENRPYINGLLFGDADGHPRFGLTSNNGEVEAFTSDAPYLDIWEDLVAEVERNPNGDVQFSRYNTVPDYLNPERFVHRIGLAIPVLVDGELVAIIGMLVDGNHILSVLRQFLTSHPREINFALVDNSGRWIMRLQEGILSYFTFNSTTLQEEIPQVWKSVNAADVGELSLEQLNYHYRAYDPLEGVSNFYDRHTHFLVGILSFSDEHITVLEDSFLLRNKPLRWVLALMIIVLGGFINVLAYFRRNDRELLAVSNLVSDQSHDGVVITDTMQHVSYCNRTFEIMTGFNNDEVRAGRHRVVTLDGTVFDASKTIDQLHGKEASVSSWQGFLWVEGKRHIALTHLFVSTVMNNHGHVVQNVGLYSNPRNLSRESFEPLMLEDETYVNEVDKYPIQLIQQLCDQKKDFVLVYLKLVDIDLIEAQYSLYEHYVLGSQIRERLARALDHDDLLIQYSPDTFLFTVHVEKERSLSRLERLDHIFRKPLGLRERQQVVHARFGISSPAHGCPDAGTILRQSRMALAALDHYSRNGSLRYDQSIDEHLIRYHMILQAFGDAIELRTIRVYYQPVVNVITGEVVSAEALVRWTHPTLGPISPAEFIPIIEQNKLERKLGTYVTEHVAMLLGRLQDQKSKPIAISMNLCPTELQDPDLVPHMVRTLDTQGIAHERLVIELTERTLLTDLEAANRVLDMLHREHIKVAIDDFGTGFSSLSYLHELHVDLLKIDRSFIKDYPAEDDGVILKAMVGMARELDIPVLVEGIETTEQLQLLKQLNVSSYQGFLFSKAIDADAFKNMLDASSMQSN